MIKQVQKIYCWDLLFATKVIKNEFCHWTNVLFQQIPGTWPWSDCRCLPQSFFCSTWLSRNLNRMIKWLVYIHRLFCGFSSQVIRRFLVHNRSKKSIMAVSRCRWDDWVSHTHHAKNACPVEPFGGAQMLNCCFSFKTWQTNWVPACVWAQRPGSPSLQVRRQPSLSHKPIGAKTPRGLRIQ